MGIVNGITEVMEALENLTAAMDGLTLKPDKRAELADLVENAKAIDTDKYTDETVKVFRESLSIAEDVLQTKKRRSRSQRSAGTPCKRRSLRRYSIC